jgi:hypothetical protein
MGEVYVSGIGPGDDGREEGASGEKADEADGEDNLGRPNRAGKARYRRPLKRDTVLPCISYGGTT